MRSARFAFLAVIFFILAPLTGVASNSWGGSTADDGMGHSITVEGETRGNDSNITITVRDKTTGKVIKVIKKYRSRTGARTESITNNDDGTSTREIVDEDTRLIESTGQLEWRRIESTTTFSGPDKTGHVTGGKETDTKRLTDPKTGKLIKRTKTGIEYDPAKHEWRTISSLPAVPTDQRFALVLPHTADPRGVIEGSATIEVTDADGSRTIEPAIGTVTATVTADTAKGRWSHIFYYTLGALAFDAIKHVTAAARFNVAASYAGSSDTAHIDMSDVGTQTRPRVDQANQQSMVLPVGGMANITGSLFAPQREPEVFLCTRQSVESLDPAAFSNTDIRTLIPIRSTPGIATVIVENGTGHFTQPLEVNPVGVHLDVPPHVRVGQTFQGSVSLMGLTEANKSKRFTAQMHVSGHGRFAAGGNDVTTQIIGGRASAAMIATSAGTIQVTVSDVTPVP
ncbi:MAG TPA: hypothetical protein VGR69_06540 [Candidatus Rubrimentiphilum sp.]|nr:hypothetical protein [Candidatus Rubrimentiphilum sp.]